MKSITMKHALLFLAALGCVATTYPTPRLNKHSVSNVQRKAFLILQDKCNRCHVTQNPGKVFTLSNMNELSRKINRQVFVWKRMPKGNNIRLSAAEKADLKNWIDSLKPKQ